MKIYVWPDAAWCYEDELEEYLSYKSDDYVYTVLSDTCHLDDIDKFAYLLVNPHA